ncbi:MAG TPA: amidohydrolase family protein [Candidatus Sulfopaludibacter sp.]|jgi:imidazolonepropionase-like amidohydrolase|nr:amidohydrolase family protein [Candidatus Sulfopaludibacter sp.]
MFVHATIYTAPGLPAVRDGAILTGGDRIVAVGRTSDVVSAGMRGRPEVYDCTGLTITAGFWNSHVHMIPPPLLHVEKQLPGVVNAQLKTMFNRWGFTTVFDLASVLANTNQIRRRIAAGMFIGPRILTTGEPIWAEVPIYVERFIAANHIAMPATSSASDARTRVDQQLRDGADAIKIFAGSIEASEVVLLPRDIAEAAVDEAHRNHRLVFSHPSSIKGVELSLDSGADILAHVSTFEGPWPPALVKRMVAAHISLIPTLTLFDVEEAKSQASRQQTQEVVGLAVSQLRSYKAAGGQVLFGTDIGYIDHYDTAEEFRLMAEAGMSFPEILASMTTTPATRFGYGDHSGRIAVGMEADLAVLKADPAADITALAHVMYTIRAGRVIFDDRSRRLQR